MRTELDLLLAWLDAARREDREALCAMLARDVTWEGVRPQWRCAGPDEVVAAFLERVRTLDDLERFTVDAHGGRAALHLVAPGLGDLDDSLRHGVWIGFEIAAGRFTRLTDHARRDHALPTVPAETPHGVPEGEEGWWVMNVAGAEWRANEEFGAYALLERSVHHPQIGINVGVLWPGQPACWYHREGDQEGFLVLKGACLLLVEGQERVLRQWDYFHCPAWTEHVVVGAGDGPCTVLALGARSGGGVVYPAAPFARAHGAAVEREMIPQDQPYADVSAPAPLAFDPHWLP